MSCNLSLRTAELPSLSRRTVLSAAILIVSRWTSVAFAGAPLDGLKMWGHGDFRRFGLLIYEVTLFAGDDPQQPPRALRLDYKRNIPAKAIATASIEQMRRFVTDAEKLQRWDLQLQQLFPGVRAGDHIIGIQHADRAEFYMAERLLGAIVDAEFAAAFFGIWLDPRTSEPELRAALLRQGQV